MRTYLEVRAPGQPCLIGRLTKTCSHTRLKHQKINFSTPWNPRAGQAALLNLRSISIRHLTLFQSHVAPSLSLRFVRFLSLYNQ
jgi:hypothetical protein